MQLNPVTQITAFNLNLTNKEAAALYWELQGIAGYYSPEKYPLVHMLYEHLTALKVGRLQEFDRTGV